MLNDGLKVKAMGWIESLGQNLRVVMKEGARHSNARQRVEIVFIGDRGTMAYPVAPTHLGIIRNKSNN